MKMLSGLLLRASVVAFLPASSALHAACAYA